MPVQETFTIFDVVVVVGGGGGVYVGICIANPPPFVYVLVCYYFRFYEYIYKQTMKIALGVVKD